MKRGIIGIPFSNHATICCSIEHFPIAIKAFTPVDRNYDQSCIFGCNWVGLATASIEYLPIANYVKTAPTASAPTCTSITAVKFTVKDCCCFSLWGQLNFIQVFKVKRQNAFRLKLPFADNASSCDLPCSGQLVPTGNLDCGCNAR